MTSEQTDWPSVSFLRGVELLESGIDDRAIDMLTAALQECHGDDVDRIAECLRWIGAAHARQDRLPEAAAAWERAADLFGDSATDLAAECADLAGTALCELERTRDAIRYLQVASSRYRLLGAIDEMAETDEMLGTMLAESGDHPAASAAFRRAGTGFLEADRGLDAAHCLLDGGHSASESGQHAPARESYCTARELFEVGDDAEGVAHSSYLIATASAELDDRSTAVREARRARSAFADLGEIGAAAECDDVLGALMAEDGCFDDAIAALESAITGYRHGQRPLQIADCHNRIAVLQLRTGMPVPALESLSNARLALLDAEEPDIAAAADVARGMVLEDLARYPEARAAYFRARQHYANAKQRGEVAWCDLNIATTHLAVGEFDCAEGLLLDALAVFEAEQAIDRAAQAQLWIAQLHCERGNFAIGEDVLTTACALAESAGSPEIIADGKSAQAGIALQMGKYDRAIRYADIARQEFERLMLWPKVGQCHQTSGTAHFLAGRYSAAEVGLSQARALYAHYGVHAEMAALDENLGLVLLEMGRFTDAEAAMRRGATVFRELSQPQRAAAADGNLGGLLLRLGRYDDARRAFRDASRLLAEAGLPSMAATASMNESGAAILLGDVSGALSVLRSARERFGTDPAHSAELAVCERNTGVAYMLAGEYEAALRHLATSRTISSELRRMVDVAKSDFLAAAVLVAAYGRHRIAEALDLAIPAQIFVDAQRLQFTNVRSRLSLSELNDQFHVVLLEWAGQHGDAQLVADLVEVSINAGSHHAPVSGDQGAKPDLFGLASAMLRPTADETGPEIRADGGHYTGSSDLLSGAHLPMRPSPRLLMPDGRLALSPYVESSDLRYAPIERPPSVRTW